MQWREQAQPISSQPCSSPQMNFSLTWKSLILFPDFLRAKYNQSRSGDQRRKRIWGAAISMWGSTFLKASDQSSTAPSPGHSSTHSREENKPVRVLGSDTATLGAIEMKSGTASSPSKWSPVFTAALLPKKIQGSPQRAVLWDAPAQLSRLTVHGRIQSKPFSPQHRDFFLSQKLSVYAWATQCPGAIQCLLLAFNIHIISTKDQFGSSQASPSQRMQEERAVARIFIKECVGQLYLWKVKQPNARYEHLCHESMIKVKSLSSKFSNLNQGK